MLLKLVFSCFKLCLLVVLCTAAPAADSDSSSGSDHGGKIVKLKGGAGAALSDLSGTEDDGKVVKLQGNDALPSDGDANEGRINAEGKNDASVAEEAKDAEKNTDNGVLDDNPDANEEPINADEKDAAVAEEPIDGEKNTENEIQDEREYINTDEKYTDPPIDDEKEGDEVQNKSGDNKITEHDENDGTSPSPSVTEENEAQPIVKNKRNGFDLTPAEKIKFKIWPEAKIPYYIDELSYDKVLRDKIRSYLDEVRSLTVLRFEELLEPPAGEDERWVFFINRRGQLDCKDYNTNSFTTTGVQKVIIGYDCLEHGGPMAAVVLALAGVPPQHNSPNRDRYITVMTDHILPEKKGLFRRLKDSEWLFHNLEYDFDSVSHYPTHKYTADGSETIQILDSTEREKRTPAKSLNIMDSLALGDRSWTYNNEKRTYSSQDLLKIRFLYEFIVGSMSVGIKPEDCKALYRPGPSFSKMKLKGRKKVLAMKKPKKYLDAVGHETGADKLLGKGIDIRGEALSSLE